MRIMGPKYQRAVPLKALYPAVLFLSSYASAEEKYLLAKQKSFALSPSSFAFCIPPTSPKPLLQRSFTSLSGGGDDSREEPSVSSPSLEFVAEQFAASKFRNVVVLVGAGASVSAGIPDFRSPGTGLYDRMQHYNLPFPEAIFELDYYLQNPAPFVDLCKSIWPGQEGGPKPTVTHAFLKLLQDKNCLRRVYTQNIDGLEALAGVSTPDRLVECHGHFRTTSCVSCHASMDSEQCLESIKKGEAPRCDKCNSLVKPDIVFFGEEMPARFQELVDQDTTECDLLLVIGTSLLVMPVAGIPSWVNGDCIRVLLNREPVGAFLNRGRPGSKHRDVFVEGDCDDSVRQLCKLAGWERELEELYSKGQ